MLDYYIRNLSAREKTISTFDEQGWTAAIGRVVIETTGRLTFRFKDVDRDLPIVDNDPSSSVSIRKFNNS